MASQWETFSVCGSQLTIIVPGCVLECGKRSRWKHRETFFTSQSAQNLQRIHY